MPDNIETLDDFYKDDDDIEESIDEDIDEDIPEEDLSVEDDGGEAENDSEELEQARGIIQSLEERDDWTHEDTTHASILAANHTDVIDKVLDCEDEEELVEYLRQVMFERSGRPLPEKEEGEGEAEAAEEEAVDDDGDKDKGKAPAEPAESTTDGGEGDEEEGAGVGDADEAAEPADDEPVDDEAVPAEPAAAAAADGGESSPVSPGGRHWTKVTKEVKPAIGVAEVLEGWGWAAGVKPSTLASYYYNENATASYMLQPAIAANGLTYSDLFLDENNELRPINHPKTSFKLKINKVVGLPEAPKTVTVLDRRVRIALWEEVDPDHYCPVNSNVHIVRGKLGKVSEIKMGGGVIKRRENWKFDSRGNVVWKEHDNTTVVRLPNEPSSKLSLLLEVTMYWVRNSAGGSKEAELNGESSTGWAMIPIFDGDGAPLKLKEYKVPLNGGTPGEEGVALGNPAELDGKSSGWFGKKVESPMISVSLEKLGRTLLHQAAYLPDVFITSVSLLPLMENYRKLLAQHLLRGKEHVKPVQPKSAPVLKIFLEIVDSFDLCEWLGLIYARVMEDESTRNKNSTAFKLAKFSECVLDVWALRHVRHVAKDFDMRPEMMEERFAYIEAFLAHDAKQSMSYNEEDRLFEPFDVTEVTYDPLAPLHDLPSLDV